MCRIASRMIDFPCFFQIQSTLVCSIRKINEEAGKVIAQILLVVIFVAMFILIVLEVWENMLLH